MRSRLLWRRLATALGIYGSTALGILGTIVAARVLGTDDFGRFAEVIAVTAFFQLLLDLTSEEALVKYGFRYAARGDWGRFRRLLRVTTACKQGGAVLAALLVAAFAPFADSLFGTEGLLWPLLLAAVLPPLQSLEGLAASTLILRERYDLRAGLLSVSMGLRLVGLAIGSQFGLLGTVAGLVAAQAVATTAIALLGLAALRRFPRAAATPLGADRREILRFVAQSSVGTGILSLRGWIPILTLGAVRDPVQAGLFRAAQAPQQGLGALSSPVRLILLTEQTRDWERGKPGVVMAYLRRYVIGSALLMAAAIVPLWLAMPFLVRLFLGADYLGAVDAARIMLVVAAIQLVFGWTKSFPVSIGRPDLRILAHGVELVVLLPFLIVFATRWGAAGAAGAVLISAVAFALVWTVIVLRMRRSPLASETSTPPLAPEATAH